MFRTVLAASIATSLLAAACGPAAKDEKTGPDNPGEGGTGEGQDQTLDYEATAITGTYFVPEALDRPSMLLAHAPRKITLEKQRAAYKKAKGAVKVDQAVILATMLYEAAQASPDEAKRTALLGEARQVLTETWTGLPKETDEVLLHNLACLAFDAGDLAGAAQALHAAVEKAPSDKGTPERRAYLAFYLLRTSKNAEAMTALQGVEPTPSAPELSYVLAWASWRSGDAAKARAAMLAAVQGWSAKGFLPAIKRDVLIFAARTGASPEESQALATAFAQHIKDRPDLKGDASAATLETMFQMYQAFKFAGRIEDSIALLDHMFTVRKDLNKSDVPELRFEQADAARRLGRAEELVSYTRQALEALTACGAPCQGATADAGKRVFNWARYSNYLYTTSQDARWYQAGKELYAMYLALPGITDGPTVKGEANTLDHAFNNAKKNAGTHDKQALQYVLDGYAAQVVGCYDAELQQDPSLGGQLALKLEIADTGKVSGASSEPGPGEDGLAAVAACATEKARGWAFPARTRAGVTRLGVAYALQPTPAK